MRPIKVVLRMEIMTRLNLDQLQHLMDIRFHRQLLVKYVLWRNNPFVYLWEAYNRVRFYLINIFKARSNIPNARKWSEKRYIMMIFYFSNWYFFSLISFFSFCFYPSFYDVSQYKTVQFIKRLSFTRSIA
jgi:hypothetical protein